MKPEIKSLLSDYEYTYFFPVSDYNVESMRESGLLVLEVHEELNGKDYMYIATSICCDDWFC
jgi:hypothetical protein